MEHFESVDTTTLRRWLEILYGMDHAMTVGDVLAEIESELAGR